MSTYLGFHRRRRLYPWSAPFSDDGTVSRDQVLSAELSWRIGAPVLAFSMVCLAIPLHDYVHANRHSNLVHGAGAAKSFTPARCRIFRIARASGAVDTPFISGRGVIYYGCVDGSMHATVLSTGRDQWRVKILGHDWFYPAIDASGNLYAESDNGRAYSISPGGRVRWSRAMPFPPSPDTPPVILGRSTWLVDGAGGALYGLALDGRIRWKFSPGTPVIIAVPASSGAMAYVSTGFFFPETPRDEMGCLYAISSHGVVLWKLCRRYLAGPALSNGTTVLDGSIDGVLYSIDRRGHVDWETRTGGGLVTPLAVLQDGAIIATNDDGVMGLSGRGAVKWRVSLSGGLTSASVRSPTALAFATSDGFVYEVSPDGRIRWKRRLGGAPLICPTTDDGYLCVCSKTDRVYWLAADGSIRCSAHVGTRIEEHSISALGRNSVVFADERGGIYRIDGLQVKGLGEGADHALISGPWPAGG